ncbi:MAG: hypothetical protein L0207_00205 [Chlamydiae bacterium]|nr:hypothetical protein [Chlamydiota bacterium]
MVDSVHFTKIDTKIDNFIPHENRSWISDFFHKILEFLNDLFSGSYKNQSHLASKITSLNGTATHKQEQAKLEKYIQENCPSYPIEEVLKIVEKGREAVQAILQQESSVEYLPQKEKEKLIREKEKWIFFLQGELDGLKKGYGVIENRDQVIRIIEELIPSLHKEQEELKKVAIRTLSSEEKAKLVLPIFWYFLSLAIEKDQAFSKGLMRIHDPDNRIIQFLLSAEGVYERGSTHFSSLRKEQREFKKGYGFDVKPEKGEIRLPGKFKTIHFGEIEWHEGSSWLFMKPEIAGTNSMKDRIEHGFTYLETRLSHLSGTIHKQGTRREHLPKEFEKQFDNFIKEFPLSTSELEALKKSKSLYGISAIIDFLVEYQKNKDSKIDMNRRILLNEFLRSLLLKYDHIFYRSGNEVILFPEEVEQQFYSTAWSFKGIENQERPYQDLAKESLKKLKKQFHKLLMDDGKKILEHRENEGMLKTLFIFHSAGLFSKEDEKFETLALLRHATKPEEFIAQLQRVKSFGKETILLPISFIQSLKENSANEMVDLVNKDWPRIGTNGEFERYINGNLFYPNKVKNVSAHLYGIISNSIKSFSIPSENRHKKVIEIMALLNQTIFNKIFSYFSKLLVSAESNYFISARSLRLDLNTFDLDTLDLDTLNLNTLDVSTYRELKIKINFKFDFMSTSGEGILGPVLDVILEVEYTPTGFPITKLTWAID